MRGGPTQVNVNLPLDRQQFLQRCIDLVWRHFSAIGHCRRQAADVGRGSRSATAAAAAKAAADGMMLGEALRGIDTGLAENLRRFEIPQMRMGFRLRDYGIRAGDRSQFFPILGMNQAQHHDSTGSRGNTLQVWHLTP